MDANSGADLAAIKQQLAHIAAAIERLSGTPVLTCNAMQQQQQQQQQQQHRPQRARIADESSSPLDRDELLDRIFCYVGIGDYLYAAGVSRRWKGRYTKLCYNKAADDDDSCKLRTYYVSALITAARLELAFKSKLQLEDLQAYPYLGYDVARSSLEPIQVLIVAKTFDMRWSSEFCSDAAFHGKLDLLQWLYDRRCPWQRDTVLTYAAAKGSVSMLIWLQTVIKPWSAAQRTHMLNRAVEHSKLEAVQWLRLQGAEWSNVSSACVLLQRRSHSVTQYNMIKWILANGCSWANWQCAKVSAVQYYTDANKQRRAELFTLAHEHGCPCTCEAHAANAAQQ
jgi:hypothetical protein